METVLMVVTLVALALAVGMAVLAWRLLRDDRQRASARAEALLAMATTDELAAAPAPAPPPVEGLGAWDLGLGAAERFSELDIRPHAPSPKPQAPSLKPQAPSLKPQAPSLEIAPLFAATDERGAPGGRWFALTAVAVLMAAVVGTIYALHRPGAAAANSQIETAASTVPTGAARPLELLSLRHTSEPDGTFTVTGLVQNPADGRVIRGGVAVVYVFDRDGNYFASGKASLDFTALDPGEESPFVVHVANVAHVSRYRVGFRSEEGGVIAHIDRRGQLPGGTTGDALDTRPAVNSTAVSRRSEG